RLRAGADTRLATELLLLRWAMMDRTIEIGEVLDALKAGNGETGTGKGEAPTATGSASPRPTSHAPRPASPPEAGPLSVDRMRAAWPAIVAEARAKSPILGAVMADTEVGGVDGDVLTIRLLDQNPVHADGIERQRDALTGLVARFVTGAVKLRVERPGGSGSLPRAERGERSPARPDRLTEQTAKGERLKVLRAKDPALDRAVDALDLELME
ncbi:MAG TPA: hypothetical protein VE549_08755, partial [Myxococcaceae bacterium]|nr:hypothetical protein [Myxococcaceae bacterium]